MATTTTLAKAYRELAKLPPRLQDEFGEKLLGYVTEFRALMAQIDVGTKELERGEGIEVTNIDAQLDKITGHHGRS